MNCFIKGGEKYAVKFRGSYLKKRFFTYRFTVLSIQSKGSLIMPLKPGPKPIAKSTGKPDQRRRDNKTTSGNTRALKPSKSSFKK